MDDRLPSHVQAQRAVERARLMALTPQPSAFDHPAGGNELHLHYHEAPVPVAAGPAPASRDDAGWALLNRLAPWLILAGMLTLIVTGCGVVLVWALGLLVVLIHSLLALVVAGIGVIGAVAVLAAVLKTPSVWIKGNGNSITGSTKTTTTKGRADR
jgi:hypothetical protein